MQSQITLQFPPAEEADPGLPTLAERRSTVNAAIEASLEYATAAWEVALRWLASVDVDVRRLPDLSVSITTSHGRERGRTHARAAIPRRFFGRSVRLKRPVT